jgi:hypothetical protein
MKRLPSFGQHFRIGRSKSENESALIGRWTLSGTLNVLGESVDHLRQGRI